jgi:aquaporin Z
MEDTVTESLSKRLCAEFLGTFWLVFGGCGSAVLTAKFVKDGTNTGLGIGFWVWRWPSA